MADNLLYETKSLLMTCAGMLPEIEVNGVKTNKYEDYSIDDLANGYCSAIDNNDTVYQDVYLSALILRFWYTIDKMYYKVRGTDFDRADVFNRLCDCIRAACQYRAWQNPEKNTNAQACINQVLASRGVPAMIAEYNQKHHTKCMYSLDCTIDKDSAATLGDLVSDSESEAIKLSEEKTASVIQALINNGKIIEAIIADNIATKDVFKHSTKLVTTVDAETGEEYKYTKVSDEFWPFQLVKELNALDDKYYRYFAKMYYIKDDKLQPAITALNNASNSKKYKYIDCTKEIIANYMYLLK